MSRWHYILSYFCLVAVVAAQDVRFEQRIGQRLPLEVRLVDTAGVSQELGSTFHQHPVVLFFTYARCPQLCSIVADDVVGALRQIRPLVGRDLEVVAISLDPDETARETGARERDAAHRYGDLNSSAGWHFLRGSAESIAAVASAAGFHYVYDLRSREYAHPSGFVVVTPEGVVSNYFLGVDFNATDVSRAVGRAARGETGEAALDVLLRCFRGDGPAGRYGVVIWSVLSVSVALTVLALVGGIGWMLWEERRNARRQGELVR